MKWLLFVRHTESSKNLEDRFARRNDSDSLTETGNEQAQDLAVDVCGFARHLTAGNIIVASSDSPRAMESASALAALVGVELIKDPNLRSIIVPETEGMSTNELLATDPGAAREYNLYRGGLYSSYRLRHTGKYSRSYEARVRDALDRYLALSEEVGIVFAHRSTFTTALIAFARDVGYYPDEFFGYLPMEFGCSALVEFCGGTANRVVFANLPHRLLNSTGRLFLTQADN